MLIGAVDEWRRWALFTLPDIGDWSNGPVALLGDAAHAMLPFAAQGAGMAIEDAAVLAKCLERQRRRKYCRDPGRAEALRQGCAARACCGCSAPRGSRDGSIISPVRWRWRATSPSRRWARSACWRGRTGSTTGGRDDADNSSPIVIASEAKFRSPVIPRACGGSGTLRLIDSIANVSGILDHQHTQGDDSKKHSRGMFCPKFCISFALGNKEGAGKTGCALHPRSRRHDAKRICCPRASGSADNTPASPTQGRVWAPKDKTNQCGAVRVSTFVSRSAGAINSCAKFGASDAQARGIKARSRRINAMARRAGVL